ncbi:MAG: hypothetical protein CMJ62_13720 [Planctomycetaceae bacterium]|nr:hypothetical protein [Planctomycetaceae bacterium]
MQSVVFAAARCPCWFQSGDLPGYTAEVFKWISVTGKKFSADNFTGWKNWVDDVSGRCDNRQGNELTAVTRSN